MVATGFMAFSIPLISSSLGLAQTVNIDAQVKNEAMHDDYCAIAVQEYISYLVSDTGRWQLWLAENIDLSDPSTYNSTLDLCGGDITITVSQVTPDSSDQTLDDEIGVIPFTGAYNQRDFQTFKTVSDSNPIGGDTVEYTIKVVNRSADPVGLNDIRDTLPSGFHYDCSAPTNQLTLPGGEPQDIFPGIECLAGSNIDWAMPVGTVVDTGEFVLLSFHAVTNDDPGTYCNEVKVVPGGVKTRSGQTAIVEIGETGGLCPGDAVLVSQDMIGATLVATDDTTVPYTYTFDVRYLIDVENIGTMDVTLAGFIDLLPEGFSYFSMEPTGDITEAPSNLHQINQLDRQRVTWDFSPQVTLAPGQNVELEFNATGLVGQGNYWVDLLVAFAEGTFSEKRYTWPTAVVAVKDVYVITAIDANGKEIVVGTQVWIEGDNGLIANYGLNPD